MTKTFKTTDIQDNEKTRSIKAKMINNVMFETDDFANDSNIHLYNEIADLRDQNKNLEKKSELEGRFWINTEEFICSHLKTISRPYSAVHLKNFFLCVVDTLKESKFSRSTIESLMEEQLDKCFEEETPAQFILNDNLSESEKT